jgi:hypothetical protein
MVHAYQYEGKKLNEPNDDKLKILFLDEKESNT